jgi:hypothetical protein
MLDGEGGLANLTPPLHRRAPKKCSGGIFETNNPLLNH